MLIANCNNWHGRHHMNRHERLILTLILETYLAAGELEEGLKYLVLSAFKDPNSLMSDYLRFRLETKRTEKPTFTKTDFLASLHPNVQADVANGLIPFFQDVRDTVQQPDPKNTTVIRTEDLRREGPDHEQDKPRT